MSDGTEISTSKSGRQRLPQVQALCCECGNVRTTSTYMAMTEPPREMVEWFGSKGDIAPRCTVRRKCSVCNTQTRHAWLRDDLPEDDREVERPTLGQVISPMITRHVEQLEACEIDVRWRQARHWRDGQVACLMQWLDDNTFCLELNSEAHVVHLAGALEAVWGLLARYDDDLTGWRSVAADRDDPDSVPLRYKMFMTP